MTHAVSHQRATLRLHPVSQQNLHVASAMPKRNGRLTASVSLSSPAGVRGDNARLLPYLLARP